VHIRFGTAAFGLGLAAMLIWLAVLGAPDGKLHISLLDVEGGPAVLLQTPAGQNILVNGGSNSRTLGREMDRRISPVYRNLDVLILANPFSTNLPFWQEILRRYPPGMVLWGSDPTAIKSSTKLENYLHNQPSPEGILKDGQELALGNGVILRALSTDEKGTVFLVEWQRFRLIWDGRSVKDNKKGSLLSYPGLSGLIIASPSADKSLIKEWVQSKPGIIMTGNWSGTPESGVNWLDTSAKGWISLSTDGQQLWIETQK